MSVNSEQNKSLLNELLKSLINENKFDYNEKEFNNYFNQSCDYYNTQRHDYGSLQEINQKIIGECFNFLVNKNYVKPTVFSRGQEELRQEKMQKNSVSFMPESTKMIQQFRSSSSIELIHESPSATATNKDEIYLRSDIKRKNRDQFEMQLKAQQDNFNDTINVKPPTNIDFSDKSQDGPIVNINNVINQTLEDREKELMKITKQYQSKKAKQWLNQNGDDSEMRKIDDGNRERGNREGEGNVKLQSIMRDENSPTGSQNKKRVSFNPLQQFESMDGPSEPNFETNFNSFVPPTQEVIKEMGGMSGIGGMGEIDGMDGIADEFFKKEFEQLNRKIDNLIIVIQKLKNGDTNFSDIGIQTNSDDIDNDFNVYSKIEASV